MFGILDIHPFVDGNGRLARIAANWALRRAGLPFCINIFATPAQRQMYVHAITMTRRNLCLVARGHVPQETMVDIMARSGLFSSLVQLVVEQVSRAVSECNKLVAEKAALAVDEREAKAARQFREKAAAGSCLICFDENPNIATLCCGKAAHLNCIAQWLSSRNSCPQCRKELPSLAPRVAAPAAPQQEDDTTSDVENATSWDDTETTTTDEAPPVQNYNDDTTEDMSQGSTTQEVQQHHADTTTDDTTSEVEENNDTTSEVEENNDTTASDDTIVVSSSGDDDTTDYTPPARSRPLCTFGNCRNRPAADCSNDACGRCCVLYGNMSCHRHNS
jgi:hypothetical protein